jgi:serine/threonine protein kinase
MTYTELTGTVVGERYEIVSLLGTGGMASVYRAHDRSLGRDVALKLFAAPGSSLQRETAEIRLLASLNHHALVTLFDARVDGGSGAYLVMELVEGPTLGERITGGPVFEADAAHLLVDLADALHVVHERGIVHRDIKPANILLSASGSPSREFRAKLSDFGIAYLVDSTRLTTPGTVIGTAAYVSPEQARGTAPGPAGDIYSLGLVVLEALTAVRAFPGSMVESISARLVNDPAVPAALGAQWVALLTGMTARDPADRPSALEVAERGRALERSLHAAAGGAAAAVSSVDAATEPFASRSSMPPAPPSRDEYATLVLPTTLPEGADAPFPNSIHTTSGAQRAAKPPVRAILITGIALLGAAAIIAVGMLLGGSGAEEAAPEPVPTLPANDGELGAHLDRLLESVTP